jgi:hypothetical protein
LKQPDRDFEVRLIDTGGNALSGELEHAFERIRDLELLTKTLAVKLEGLEQRPAVLPSNGGCGCVIS